MSARKQRFVLHPLALKALTTCREAIAEKREELDASRQDALKQEFKACQEAKAFTDVLLGFSLLIDQDHLLLAMQMFELACQGLPQLALSNAEEAVAAHRAAGASTRKPNAVGPSPRPPAPGGPARGVGLRGSKRRGK